MRTLLSVTLIALLFVAVAPAQAVPETLPSLAGTKQSNYYDFYGFYGTTSAGRNNSQVQWLYDVADIKAAGMLVRGLEVRRPTTIGNSNAATTFDSVIVMSVGPNAPAAAKPTFAQNHGTAKTTVFRAKISLPANTNGPWPAPWLPKITFSTPFPYANTLGKSLVIDMTNTNNSNLRTYYIEGNRPGVGRRVTERSSCNFAAGGRNTGLSHRNPQVGGTFLVNYNRYPKNQASFNGNVHVFGLAGRGGTYGGRTLPILLNSLRLPVFDANCALATDVFLGIPGKYNAAAGRIEGGTFSIPNNPFLADKSFYTQVISLDNDPNKGPVLHASWASKWTIGDGVPARGATVYQLGTTNPTGSVRTGTVATVRISP